MRRKHLCCHCMLLCAAIHGKAWRQFWLVLTHCYSGTWFLYRCLFGLVTAMFGGPTSHVAIDDSMLKLCMQVLQPRPLLMLCWTTLCTPSAGCVTCAASGNRTVCSSPCFLHKRGGLVKCRDSALPELDAPVSEVNHAAVGICHVIWTT